MKASTSVSKAKLIANTLYQFCKEGISINSRYNKPESGYMVATHTGPIFRSVKDINPIAVEKWIEGLLSLGSLYFGAWTDKDNGYIHFDGSICVADKETALHYGREALQHAIYDVENEEEIRL